jgi:hypothetical protein
LENGKLVDRMRHAVLEGEINIKNIPSLMKQVIETRAWEKGWVCSYPVEHKTFLAFISTAPLDGMGWEKEEDKERIASLLRFDPEVLRMWHEAIMLPAGTNQYTMVHNNIMDHKPVKQGTSLAYTLDRLKRERPDLFERVVAKQLSANAAAIAAGFRKKLTPLETIVKAIAKARPLLTAQQRREIRAMLE